MKHYPIMLNVEGLSVAIVGGGRVGRRRAAALAAAGARVRVVDPAAVGFGDDVEVVAQTYRGEHLEGASLVVACTDDPAVNARVVADARAIGALVNRADDSAGADFVFPAVHCGDGVTVAVATDEPAPTAATALLAAAAEALGGEAGEFARAVADIRRDLKARAIGAGRLAALLGRLGSVEALAAFRTGGREALQRLLDEK